MRNLSRSHSDTRAPSEELTVEPPAEPRAHAGGLTWRAHLFALAGYTLLTLILTDPLPSQLFTEVIGGGDVWQNIWNLWWVKESLVTDFTNPYFTDLLNFPDGAPLYLHTLAPSAGVMSIPLQLLGLGLVPTFNIILLLTFVLGGYGAFLLCHYVSKSHWGSFVGGCVFAFSPYHFAHLYGHMNLASLQWIPFYALLLLKAMDAPGGQRRAALLLSAAAGSLLALNAYTDWIYALFLGLFTGLILIWKVALPTERRAFAGRGVSWVEGGLRVVVGGGVALLLVAPILFPTLAEAGKGYAQQPPRETLVYSSDVTLAFTPSELHPIWGGRIARHVNGMGEYNPLKHPSERTLFLGYTVLGLAGYGLWRLRSDRQALMWGFVAFSTWVFTLGPILQVLGKSNFTPFNVTVPLPYLILYKLPLFNIMRTPSRLTVLTMLALGVLVALAISTIRARQRTDRVPERVVERGVKGWLPVVARYALPVLILFEFWSAPFVTVPPGWDVPIYEQLAQESGRFGVLELPIRQFGDYMAYQTLHGKPIVGGYISRQPPYPTLENTPALRYMLDATPLDDPARDRITGGAGEAALRDLQVKYVIIRWWAFTEEQKGVMEAKLNTLLGRPPDITYPEHQVDVWRVY